MRTADPDLHETFAPLREVEPTPEDIARVLRAADELARRGRSTAPPGRRPPGWSPSWRPAPRLIGVPRRAAREARRNRPQDAHGILQAAAAVAAQQPGPAAYRYTRALDRFVYVVNAPDGPERPRGRAAALGELDRGRLARDGRPPHRGSRHVGRAAQRGAADGGRGDVGAIVKPYDGAHRYGDGPLARVPFDAIPRTPRRRGAPRGGDP